MLRVLNQCWWKRVSHRYSPTRSQICLERACLVMGLANFVEESLPSHEVGGDPSHSAGDGINLIRGTNSNNLRVERDVGWAMDDEGSLGKGLFQSGIAETALACRGGSSHVAVEGC